MALTNTYGTVEAVWPNASRTWLASKLTALVHSAEVSDGLVLSYSFCNQTTAVGAAFSAVGNAPM